MQTNRLFILLEGAETEIGFSMANGTFKMKMDIHRHGPRSMPSNCKNLNPPNFSLPTTFKSGYENVGETCTVQHNKTRRKKRLQLIRVFFCEGPYLCPPIRCQVRKCFRDHISKNENSLGNLIFASFPFILYIILLLQHIHPPPPLTQLCHTHDTLPAKNKSIP